MELKTLTQYAKTNVYFTINRNKNLYELGHCVDNITCQAYAVETKILVGGSENVEDLYAFYFKTSHIKKYMNNYLEEILSL